MYPQACQMEQMLASLGEAHKDGAFTSHAGVYPWRVGGAEAMRLTHRRFAWVRVAAPLAAAAAIAALFAGPRLWTPPAANELADSTVVPVDVTPKPAPSSTQQPATGTAVGNDCDYNGDGRVDGADIQAFIDRRLGANEDPSLEAEHLQRCLLGL